ncbi:hypothetical protein NUW58_g2256 [Xylaria curta]|uniref:Uncharacterized protein n=1 Tax=Xylaria curta TaxID=42375 RepID=A0ACC1PGG5_9PEZI|nr:hypothetical protein NUW58_g2256 [Xylaria curta]
MCPTRQDIAIVGSGCHFPGHASTPSRLWDLLTKPRVVAGPVPSDRFNIDGFYSQERQHHGQGNVREAYFLAEDNVSRCFDAKFFGMNTAEANVLDPQIRLLLETTYEALESSGQTIVGLKGSDTAVYVGQMTADYESLMLHDPELMGKYHATGTSRAMTANRVSFFFDWHGPSMTIDTACSSSLVAVHEAVQQLRTGGSRVAIAAGVNLLLGPNPFISESKLQMLSIDGRSRMWDANAKGYARGEGIAAVVLKRLADAEADGDHIECIIRQTEINTDGKTPGITMPSAASQADLMRRCYRRAGLDPSNPVDHPQFFEAHGTGTQVGDPVEAEAISSTFFPKDPGAERYGTKQARKMLVGSIKTIVGHTEGSAGLAGLLKASLALQHGSIPPNLLFDTLNPSILPFYTQLHIPTETMAWPALPDASVRRVSVNSFGFGGANAHAILEAYKPLQPSSPKPNPIPLPIFTPFVISAGSGTSLLSCMTRLSEHLRTEDNSINARDLAHTLYARRSRLQVATAISASSISNLRARLIEEIQDARKDAEAYFRSSTVRRSPDIPGPKVLGVFTGQGAQWAQMGYELVASSSNARNIIKRLEDRLSQLPDPPQWSLTEELARDASTSRINESTISQPLCTAVQILQVELLRAARVKLTAVVGHSSGEIAAAYAAGWISSDDAICIAYYRGLHSLLAGGPNAQKGSMLAVEGSVEDLQELCSEPEFRGQVCIAAINSPASLTISGNRDAIEAIRTILDDEGKFARLLKVDRAYHSHHMTPCSASYRKSLRMLNICAQNSTTSQCGWFSTVHGREMIVRDDVDDHYWDCNMVNPVLLMQAIRAASESKGLFDLAIEIGPHPALRSPVLQTLNELPYTSPLYRGRSAIETFAESLGYIWTRLPYDVDLTSYDQFLTNNTPCRLLKGLPSYAWDHSEHYWHETRCLRAYLNRPGPSHGLLGHLLPSSTSTDMQWRHILSLSESLWLTGHRLQGQLVFPAAGFVIMALEAGILASGDQNVSLVEILDLDIERALMFETEDSSVEVIFNLSNISRNSRGFIECSFKCNAAATQRLESNQLSLCASGRMRISLGTQSHYTLPPRPPRPSNLIKVSRDQFYSSLRVLEYHYDGPFTALHNLERKLGFATGSISNMEQSPYLFHPAMLDSAFQSIFLTYAAPGDGSLWTTQVPRRIRKVSVNPSMCAAVGGDGGLLFDSFLPCGTSTISGDIDIYMKCEGNAMIQIQGLECIPLSKPRSDDDREVFSTLAWDLIGPDAQVSLEEVCDSFSAISLAQETPHPSHTMETLERLAGFFLRKLLRDTPTDHPSRSERPYKYLFNFAAHVITQARNKQLPLWKLEWEHDQDEDISIVCEQYADVVEVSLLKKFGYSLMDIVQGRILPIELGMQDNILADAYSKGLGADKYISCVARVVKQISHRYPCMDIFEVGAGTGATTKAILSEIGPTFSSYTFTDLSTGFFHAAQDIFGDQQPKVNFKPFDVSQEPSAQGFARGAYDVVIASLILHATPSLGQSLRNCRQLLRPGGYLIVLEVLPSTHSSTGVVFGAFPGWWVGSSEGRVLNPGASISDWDSLLRSSGFSGCDTFTLETPGQSQLTVFVSQAIDERIVVFRDPLSASTTPNVEAVIRHLLLLGGRSPRTNAILSSLKSILRPYCETVTTITTLADVEHVNISRDTVVLSLADIDSPVFKPSIDIADWHAVKSLLLETGSFIWVTHGRRADNPHANMILGLVRSAIREVPTLDYLFLDIEDLDMLDAEFIAKALIRHNAATSWRNSNKLRITIEREIVLNKSNLVLIPRLVMCDEMNNRYNCVRRPIMSQRSTKHHDLMLVKGPSGYALRQTRPNDRQRDETSRQLLTTHTLLPAVRVDEPSCMFLTLGVQRGSLERFVALSSACTPSTAILPSLMTSVRVKPGSESSFLVLVAYHILISRVLDYLVQGDTILVHEPDVEFVKILSAKAKLAGVCIVVTAGVDDCSDNSRGWVPIHPLTPDRVLDRLLPSKTSAFLDFGTQEGPETTGDRIRSKLPVYCRQYSRTSLFADEAWTPSLAHSSKISDRLLQAALEVSQFLSNEENMSQRGVPVIPIQALIEGDGPSPLAVVDFTSISDVPVQLQPIDSLVTFSGHKTYWLAGLTGGLGRSLCEWMVSRGARYFILSSRHPRIEQSWLNIMSASGIVIKVSECDLVQKDQVVALFNESCLTMPAFGGVAQGAMVLRDVAVQNMSLQDFVESTAPKVQGSMHLNDLFQDDSLDFFVSFSSAVSLVGNPGQANYSAANMFMEALTQQRRERGLAASVIHIGAVHGVGVITQIGYNSTFDGSVMRQGGFIPLSESDVHKIFAESVAASRHFSHEAASIYTGIRRIHDNENHPPNWESDPIMNHFVMSSKREDKAAHARNPSNIIPLHKRIAQSESVAQLHEVVQEAISLKICTLFQLDIGRRSADSFGRMRLDEMGIDSLLATEIRTWLFQTLKVNVPALKILSGMTISELVTITTESIPHNMTPLFDLNSSPPTSSDGSILPGTVSYSESSLSNQPDSSYFTLREIKPDLNPVSHHLNSEPSNLPTVLDVDTDTSPLLPVYPDPTILETYRLSFSQELFWYVLGYIEDKTSLNHTMWARLTGEIRKESLKAAVAAVGRQHQIFQTCFIEHEGKPLQGIMSKSPLALQCREIQNENEVSIVLKAMQDHVYDVKRGDTLRAILLSRSSHDHWLIVGLLPLVLDGNATRIFLAEVLRQYLRPHHHPGTSHFSQYSEQQHLQYEKGGFEDTVRFWRDQLTPPPPPLPILGLSSLTRRKPLVSYENEKVTLRIDVKTKAKVGNICQQHRATPFHFYLAVLRALILRYAHSADDIAIGVADANRPVEAVEVIGPFVNFLPLRLKATSSDAFETLLRNVRECHYTAQSHSDLPLQILLSENNIPRFATQPSVFQCCINYRQGQSENMAWGDNAELHFMGVDVKLPYDIYLEIVDIPHGDLVLTFQTRKDLYGATETNKLAAGYELLLRAFSAATNIRLDEPCIYRQIELARSERFSQGESYETRWPETVIHRIEQMANLRANEPAVTQNGATITYIEMLAYASAIATELKSSQVLPGSMVAVLQEPTIGFIASMLGIMRIGAIYVPLDPSMPEARLATIVRDCQPTWILIGPETKELANSLPVEMTSLIDVSIIERLVSHVPPVATTAASAATVLYTSGTTAVPKGVILKHEGLRNWAEHMPALYDIGFESVLQQTSPMFDLSLVQILTALCFGGQLHLVSRKQRGDANEIARSIVRNEISFTCATPLEYATWLHYGKAELLGHNAWKAAFCAGEAIPKSLLKQFSALETQNLRLYNLYGPTETSLTATAGEVSYRFSHVLNSEEPVPAGRPLPNYTIYVLDAQLRLVPSGVQGEIYIGGAGVGLGYFNKPDQNAYHFVADSFSGRDLMHRTGDMGRWREDGTLVVEGRISGSTQIKLRGLRIDLLEIENVIIEVSGGALLQVMVSVRPLSDERHEATDHLVAHVVLGQTCPQQRDPNNITRQIQSRLKTRLPLYMLPATIIPVPALPMTVSGKLDRRAASTLPLADGFTAPTTVVNQTEMATVMSKLTGIWSKILPGQSDGSSRDITPETDFFHVGGNSLLLLRLQADMKNVFAVEVPFVRLFESSTLAAMAHVIDDVSQPPESISSAAEVDWEIETELPRSLLNLEQGRLMPSRERTDAQGTVVLLTGSTGYLGSALLEALVADQNVKRVHCVAVRDIARRNVKEMMRNDKVSVNGGDLGLPRLGLSEKEAQAMMSEVDFIIHNGADTSLMKTYSTLYAQNVQSTKQLAEMSAGAGRMVPIHYISTLSVGSIIAAAAPDRDAFMFNPVSVGAHTPQLSITGASRVGRGYVASKWASEVFLERLNTHFNESWPVHIHRPSLIELLPGTGPGSELIHNVRYYSSRLSAVPMLDPGRLQGAIDLVPLQTVVDAVIGMISRAPSPSFAPPGQWLTEVEEQQPHPPPFNKIKRQGVSTVAVRRSCHGIQYLHHIGGVELAMDDVRSWPSLIGDNLGEEGRNVARQQGIPEQETGAEEKHNEVEELEIGEWTQRASKIGMHPWVVATLQSLGPAD